MGYGEKSEWQLTQMLGRHRSWFTDQVGAATDLSSITWRDFRFDSINWLGDGELLGLDFLPEAEVREAFRSWWPHGRGITNWDAVGSGTDPAGTDTLVLVEAKSTIAELRSNTTAVGGLARIQAALIETQAACGVIAPGDWTKRFYQHANRLAVLHFLTEQHVPAVLVDVFFYGHTQADTSSPPTSAAWEAALADVDDYLGLTGDSELERRAFRVFVDISGLAGADDL